MDITAAQLLTQVERARKLWPFIGDIEKRHGLPTWLLYAVGSRETNLDPYYTTHTGDGGHGYGIWQRDNRSWSIPNGYLADVTKQAEDAATLLASLYHDLGDWPSAVAAYNCGSGGVYRARHNHVPVDTYTTGHDYSTDVLARRVFLAGHYNPPTPTPPPPTKGSDVYVVRNGDTLSSIATKHHVAVSTLVRLNNIHNSNLIYPGQRLRLS